MTIVQKPSPINLSGNLPSFIMFSDDPFNFVIKKGNISLLSGSYTPGGDRKVTIDVKDVIEFSLSFQFRDILETYTQDTLIGTFYAYINDELICNFEVIKGGISNFGMTPQTFLQQHFLTWQPREKRVSYSSPEYLTYYAVTDCCIKLKAYMSTVDAIEMVISELQQGKVYTIPVMYAVVAGKLNAYPAYYDIWVESADGSVRYSYIQRFVYEQGKSEQEEYIIFENSLGGVDCFRAYGNTVFNADNTHNIAIIDDQLNEYRIDTEYKYTKNTGYLTKYEAEWLKDFFPSTGKYIFRNNILRKIVLTEDNVSSSEQESVNSYEFTYRYADDNIYLNLPVYQNSKKLISPMSLNVDNVEKSLGLEPRLAEFPMQKLSEGSLIPVQEPFSERWNATNAGAIANYIIEKINSLTDGRLLDNRFKGYYLTETSLKESYPNPLKGDSAWVGEPFPGVVYTVENGKWKTSGKAPDFGDINLEDYATKEDLAAQDSKLTELSSKTDKIFYHSVYEDDSVQNDIKKKVNRAIKELYLKTEISSVGTISLGNVRRNYTSPSGSGQWNVTLYDSSKSINTVLVAFTSVNKKGALELLEKNGCYCLIDWSEVEDGVQIVGSTSSEYQINVDYVSDINNFPVIRNYIISFSNQEIITNIEPKAYKNLYHSIYIGTNSNIIKANKAIKELWVCEYTASINTISLGLIRKNYGDSHNWAIALYDNSNQEEVITAESFVSTNNTHINEHAGVELIKGNKGSYILIDWSEYEDGTWINSRSTEYQVNIPYVSDINNFPIIQLFTKQISLEDEYIKKYNIAAISWVDDDFNLTSVPKIKAICDEVGCKCDFGLIPTYTKGTGDYPIDSVYSFTESQLELIKQYELEGFHMQIHPVHRGWYESESAGTYQGRAWTEQSLVKTIRVFRICFEMLRKIS